VQVLRQPVVPCLSTSVCLFVAFFLVPGWQGSDLSLGWLIPGESENKGRIVSREEMVILHQ